MVFFCPGYDSLKRWCSQWFKKCDTFPLLRRAIFQWDYEWRVSGYLLLIANEDFLHSGWSSTLHYGDDATVNVSFTSLYWVCAKLNIAYWEADWKIAQCLLPPYPSLENRLPIDVQKGVFSSYYSITFKSITAPPATSLRH